MLVAQSELVLVQVVLGRIVFVLVARIILVARGDALVAHIVLGARGDAALNSP